MIRQVLTDLMHLCLNCCNDGPASLERMVVNRLEAISGDVSVVIRVNISFCCGFLWTRKPYKVLNFEQMTLSCDYFRSNSQVKAYS